MLYVERDLVASDPSSSSRPSLPSVVRYGRNRCRPRFVSGKPASKRLHIIARQEVSRNVLLARHMFTAECEMMRGGEPVNGAYEMHECRV